jgi:hypothetical protein
MLGLSEMLGGPVVTVTVADADEGSQSSSPGKFMV